MRWVPRETEENRVDYRDRLRVLRETGANVVRAPDERLPDYHLRLRAAGRDKQGMVR
jgi:hypothetical protein